MSKKIVKIKYVWKHICPDIPGGIKKVYNMFDDGRIVILEYVGNMRSPIKKSEIGRSKIQFNQLVNEINCCIENADRIEWYEDDSEGTVTIYRFGRVELMDRGLGSQTTTIGAIIEKYIDGE